MFFLHDSIERLHNHRLASHRGFLALGWYARGDVEPIQEPGDGEWPYDTDGVDRSLIRWMLSLTPTERLETVESVITMLETVRRVGPDS
jgi:hypothetical protein